MRAIAILALLLGCAAWAVDADDEAARREAWRACELGDLAGEAQRPLAEREGQVAAALVFILPDCPVANQYAPEIQRIAADYAEQGVMLWVVHVDPATDAAAARAHAEDYGYGDRVLLDPEHRLVTLLGATRTPEAAVVTLDDLELAYRGRIDDRVADFGKRRREPQRRDLREALDAVVAGEPVAEPRTEVVGCFIPTDD